MELWKEKLQNDLQVLYKKMEEARNDKTRNESHVLNLHARTREDDRNQYDQ